MEKEKKKGNKIVKCLAIVGTVIGVAGLAYLCCKCRKQSRQITSLQAENGSLRNDRTILLGEVNKRDYHLGKLMTTQVLVKRPT